MASTLEQEILDKFHQLDGAAQSRVIEKMRGIIKSRDEDFDFDSWLSEMDKLRIPPQIEENGKMLSASELLAEVREERDADILHGIGFGNTVSNSPD